MNLLKKLLNCLNKNKYPENLKIKGRKKLPTSAFNGNDKLYHAFDSGDINESGIIKLNTIRFPDFSCNWSKFSLPKHIRFRQNGKKTDGCYSITVLTSRYKNIATPVHDPITAKKYPNYAHVEVRELFEGEDILFEPPKERYKKSKKSKSRRLEYRQNLLNSMEIELYAEA